MVLNDKTQMKIIFKFHMYMCKNEVVVSREIIGKLVQ